jgi:RNA polymerase sigma-70 factor (ECF subfamily)
VDDATLVDRCRRGDALAWEALVRRYQGRIYSVAVHYLRDREEARDMAQDVFIRVYERLDSFRGGDSFLPWMIRLARNACIDRLRQRRARPPAHDLPVEEGPTLPDPAPGPETRALEAARRRLLYRALEEVSDHHREMILLKDIQGLKLEEIARMLSLPLGTVKSRSMRARLELAEVVRGLDPSFATAAET